MKNRFSQESQVVMEQVIRSRLIRHIYMTTFVQQFFFEMVNQILFLFSYFSIKTCVVVTQKNRLNDVKSIVLKLMGKKIFTIFTLKHYVYLNICFTVHSQVLSYWCQYKS